MAAVSPADGFGGAGGRRDDGGALPTRATDPRSIGPPSRWTLHVVARSRRVHPAKAVVCRRDRGPVAAPTAVDAENSRRSFVARSGARVARPAEGAQTSRWTCRLTGPVRTSALAPAPRRRGHAKSTSGGHGARLSPLCGDSDATMCLRWRHLGVHGAGLTANTGLASRPLRRTREIVCLRSLRFRRYASAHVT